MIKPSHIIIAVLILMLLALVIPYIVINGHGCNLEDQENVPGVIK